MTAQPSRSTAQSTAPSTHRRMTRAVPLAAVLMTTALALAACGSSGSTGGTAAASPATSTTGADGGRGGPRQPGVSGLIAAVTGTTMQVQTRTDQTAVSWTPTTTFSNLVPAQPSDVTAGVCVTVVSSTAGGGGQSATATAAPTAVDAASVQIRPATNGSCTGLVGAGGGAAPTGTRTAAPTPGGTAGGQGARAGRGFGVNGLVTAVGGNTITVAESARPGSTATPSTVTVTTSGTTTYLKEAAATAADVKVGACATALGAADSTGAVTATSVALRPATNGQCTGGGFGGGGAGGGRTGQPTTGASAHG